MQEILRDEIDSTAEAAAIQAAWPIESPAQPEPVCLPDVKSAETNQEPLSKSSKYKRGVESYNWNKNIDQINQAIAGLATGQYSSLRQASQDMGFNLNWLINLKKNRPDIAQRIEQACAMPACQKAYKIGKAKRMSKLREHAAAAIQDRELPNINEINQAIDDLASGQYGSLQQASEAMGFTRGWLTTVKRNNPIIAQRLEQACATSKCQAKRQANIQYEASLRTGAQNHVWNQNIDKINQAIDGLSSGQYDALETASQAMGFSVRWLKEIKKKRPDIAQRLKRACATPAFQKANQRREEKKAEMKGDCLRALNQRRRAETQEQIDQAIAGLASGQYDHMRQASSAQGFHANWLYERQLIQPEIAEQLLKIQAKRNSWQSLMPHEAIIQETQQSPADVDQAPIAAESDKNTDQEYATDPEQSEQPIQIIDKPQAAAEQTENKTLDIVSGPILNLLPNSQAMSLSRQILKIIDFWDGDTDVDEVMLELEKANIRPLDLDNTRAIAASILKRKSRFINTQ